MSKKKPKLAELLGNAPEPPKYDFNLDDPDKARQEKGDVVFIMGLLNERIDPNEVRSALEKMSADIGYVNYMKHLGILVCVTDQATYERIFQTQLELVKIEKTVEKKDQIQKDPIKKIQAGYTPEGYRELKPTTVPSELSDKVRAAYLNFSF